MPQLLKNFRGTIDWSDLSKIVQKCADEAMKQRESSRMYINNKQYLSVTGSEI